MKMKTLICCTLLIVSVLTRLHLLVARFNYPPWVSCENSEYKDGSDFQHNLNQVLESLVENVSTSGLFNTIIEGQNNNSTVYGLVQCRGDLNSSDCKGSASTASKILLERCHKTSGLIQVESCFLRYDNHNFYNDYNESSKSSKFCNPNKAIVPEKFSNTTEEVLSKIIKKTVQSPGLFATDKSETDDPDLREIYSLAQCWNLSQTNCRSCLAAGRSIISGPGRSMASGARCKTGGLGGCYMSTNCILRYELYSFFNTSSIPSPPLPPPGESPPVSAGKRSKVLRITLGVLAATLGLIVVIGVWNWNFRKSWEPVSETRGEGGEINLSPSIANPELIFKYDILREATSNFKEENKLGAGGFGSVFKGVLPDAREVAIKRLNIGSRQGDTEFLNEANLISRIQHRNLVKMLGCSLKNSERLLVYEYLKNGSLDKILFDTTKRHLLDWRDRYEIIVGTARGLAYLHEESEIRIIHRDIKASNILLDNKYRPKIADFGLAKLFAEDQSHLTTRVAGTLGYMAPEYAVRGQLTEKADVFSFGVLVLEIISGRKNQSLTQDDFLMEAIWRLYDEGRAVEVMDPTLEGSYSSEEAVRVIKIGLLCTQAAPAVRPSMSRVVSVLTSEREHLSSPTKPFFVDLDMCTKTSSTTLSETHSSALDSSSSTLEPR